MRRDTGNATRARAGSPLKATAAAASASLLSSLAAHCLRYLAQHPEASGTAVRDGLGMRHLSQASRLLSRLEREGLVANRDEQGRANAWELTDRGRTTLRDLQRQWGVYA